MSGKTDLREIIRKTQVNPTHYKFEKIDGVEELVELNLFGSRMVEIPNGLFDGLRYLRSLELEFNDLRELQPTVFSDLVSLEKLNLSKNSIRELPERIFSSNKNLKKIDISENRLKKIPQDIFNNLPELRSLNLHRNNLGEFIPSNQNIFSRCDQLQVLNLRNNYIRDIANLLDNLKDLKELDLSHNSLKKFKIKDGRNIKILRLNSNELTSLDVKTFVLMDSLKEIYLQNNELTTIPPEVFQGKRLIYLDLRGNPLNVKIRQLWERHNLKKFFETVEIFG